MKKMLVAAAVLTTVAAFTAPPAGADHVTYEGGCSLQATADVTGELSNPDTQTGVLAAAVAMTNPPGADVMVTCTIKVNGAVVGTMTLTGSGLVVGGEVVSYISRAGDFVELCETVTSGGHSTTECGEVSNFNLICDTLRLLHPFVQFPPRIWIDPDGDLWIDGFRVIDC